MSLLGDARDLAVDHGLWWPDGDPGRLRHLADDWRHRGARFESAAGSVRHEARAVAVDNAGAAVDAFLAHAFLLAAELDDHADRCRGMARALHERADQIEAARRRIEAIAAEIAATVAVGFLFTALTGGLSDVAAADLTASLVAEAAALGMACTEAAAATVARVAVFATLGAWDGMLSNAVGQSTRHLVEQHELRWAIDLHEVEAAGVYGGVFGGALGYLTRPPGPLPPVPRVGPSSYEDIEPLLQEMSPGTSNRVRLVDDEGSLDQLFRRLTAGSEPFGDGYIGPRFRLDDGTLIGMRAHSSNGQATIDITKPSGVIVKVHIR